MYDKFLAFGLMAITKEPLKLVIWSLVWKYMINIPTNYVWEVFVIQQLQTLKRSGFIRQVWRKGNLYLSNISSFFQK
jgi:hypothetical protein